MLSCFEGNSFSKNAISVSQLPGPSFTKLSSIASFISSNVELFGFLASFSSMIDDALI